MSYTKKRLHAFQTILSRAPEHRKAIQTGTIGGDPRYVVTDGAAAIVLVKKPEGFTTQEAGQSVLDFCAAEYTQGNHTLVKTPPTIDECKAAIQRWNEELKHPTLGTPAQPRVHVEGDGED